MGLFDAKKKMDEAFKGIEAAEKLVQDQQTADALRVIITEAGKTIDSARGNPKLERKGSLRDAFNTAADLVPIGHDFVNSKKVPKAKLSFKIKSLIKMGEAFDAALKANNPVVLGIIDSVSQNTKIQEAAVVLAARNPQAFELEDAANGAGSLHLNLLPGQSLTVPIEPQYYTQAKEIVAKSKQQKGPGV